VLAAILLLFMATWMVIWAYILINKKTILARITSTVKEKIKGDIQIEDLETSFFSTFPFVSIKLTNVVIKDSLWSSHKHDLLQAQEIILQPRLLSLASSNPEFAKIIIRRAAIYLYTDSTGYSNEYIFHTQAKGKDSSGKKTFVPPDIELSDSKFIYDNQLKKKLYYFEPSKLTCTITADKEKLLLHIKTKMQVHSLTFNKGNGSFLREKLIEGNFVLAYIPMEKLLRFDNVRLILDHHPYTFTGYFNLTNPPPLYKLLIETKENHYKNISGILSPNISKQLDNYEIDQPLTVSASLDGSSYPNENPLVQIRITANNTSVKTPYGLFSESSFTGVFFNQVDSNRPRIDENSSLLFTNFNGKWQGLPLQSKSISFINLATPKLSCDLHSDFDLKNLDTLTGSNTIAFSKGTGHMNITYNGAVMEYDSTTSSLFGSLNFENTAVNYIPRNLMFTGCSGILEFNNKDVNIEKLNGSIGSTQMVMNGSVKNLLLLLNKQPENLAIDWNIASPSLNLDDFISFLRHSPVVKGRKTNKAIFLKRTAQIDKMLESSIVHLQLNAEKLRYKKFMASGLTATIGIAGNEISLNNAMLSHAGGTVSMRGLLVADGNYNKVMVQAKMHNVNVPLVFKAFNNFNQDAILDKNIEGSLTADIKLEAGVTDEALLYPNTLKGIIDFSLKDGQLMDFEPVKNISRSVFKNRDFSNISFAELKDRLELKGSAIKINRMEIRSTVLTMFVEGKFDMKNGTDIGIQVPLYNVGKKDRQYNLENRGIHSSNGISINLRAKTGKDGKAKISWDPFKKALKKKNEQTSNASQPSNQAPVPKE